jgi:hypothetical protein
MNIKIILMLATTVLAASVATMTIVSNPAFAEKPPHPHNHGACVSEALKSQDLIMKLLIRHALTLGHNSYLFYT